MTIAHHPPEPLVSAFAAGTLDLGQHVAIATHLFVCSECRSFAQTMEEVGGVILSDLPPAPLSGSALADVEARLAEPAARAARLPPAKFSESPTIDDSDAPRLPPFVRRYRFGAWRWVAPALHVRTITLPHASATRVFLLRSGAGTKLLQHTHTGIEMTCVLRGAFHQSGETFRPGDFDFGDETVDHLPIVEADQDCVCLVAMRGELRLKGVVGRIMQHLVRL